MNPFFKALIGIVLVAVLAGLGIFSQYKAAPVSGVTLSQDELNLFADKNLGFREKTQYANDPEARKKFLENMSKQLSLVVEAQRRGLDREPNVQAFDELNQAQVLQQAYVQEHPELMQQAKGAPGGPKASEEETKAWIDAHGADIARYQAAIQERAHGMPAPKPEDFASVFIFADKARQEGLDKKPETALQLKLTHYSLLIQTLASKLEEETKLSDDDVRKYYEEHKASGDLDQVHVEHILFATQAMPSPQNPMGGGPAPDPAAKRKLAEEVLQRIKNGEDFGELAKQYSDDPGSKEKGGDLGMANRFQFVPEFEEAAWKLQPGEVSGIVETDFGFHIIKMIERKPVGELTPQLMSQLKDSLSQKRFEEKVDEIAKNNPIDIPSDFVVTAPEQPQMPLMPPGHGGDQGFEDEEGGPAPTPEPAEKAPAPKPEPKPAAGAAKKGTK